MIFLKIYHENNYSGNQRNLCCVSLGLMARDSKISFQDLSIKSNISPYNKNLCELQTADPSGTQV